MAGLGAGLRNDGDMSDESERKALAALCRYKLLLRHMGVKEAQVVATAAVRDADNADDFVDAVTRIGLPCDVISAEEEARYSGLGVISAFPGASGIVGDLGGGSLELVEIGRRHSRAQHLASTRRASRRARKIRRTEGARDAPPRPEGSRACQGRTRQALLHGRRVVARACQAGHDRHRLPASRNASLPDEAADGRRPPADGREGGDLASALSGARLASAPVAAMLLRADRRGDCGRASCSFPLSAFARGFSIRSWKSNIRKLDPLIEAARDAGGGEHRFGQHGDVLHDWIAPLFDGPSGTGAAEAGVLPSGRCRLAGRADVPRRPRRRNGASRRLDGGRRGRAGDDGAGAHVELRARPAAGRPPERNCAGPRICTARTAGAWRCGSARG